MHALRAPRCCAVVILLLVSACAVASQSPDRGPIGPDCTCAQNSDCASGMYCQNQCTCVGLPVDPDGGTGNPACPSAHVYVEPKIPTVHLLIDQSGSMWRSFLPAPSRWVAIRDALVSDPGGVVTQLGGLIPFGASLYTHFDQTANATCPLITHLAPRLGNLADIMSLLDTNSPADETPTGQAIYDLVARIEAAPPGLKSRPVIVLCTDGLPDTCAIPTPNTQELQNQTNAFAVKAARDAHDAGIELFILSVGDEIGAPHLQDMANAGVGLPARGAQNAPYYVAHNPAELVSHLQSIIERVKSCDFSLDGPVDADNAPRGSVRLNGVPLAYGTEWRLKNPTTVELVGSACDAFLNSTRAELIAQFPCTIIVP